MLLHTQVLQSATQVDPGVQEEDSQVEVVQVACPVELQMQMLQSFDQVLPGTHSATKGWAPGQLVEHRPYFPWPCW